MDSREEQGEAIAIVGIACQFPGIRDPADLHDLTVSGRRMFRPVPGPAGRLLHGALLDGWTSAPASVTGPGPGQHDAGPLHKLTAETIALALADAGLRDAGRGQARAGLIIASSEPDVSETACAGFGVDVVRRFPPAAYLSSLHAVIAACGALSAGELDFAIAGGAELGVDLDWLARQAAAGNLGADEMRVYDADPAGLLPGDGSGVVILARAADARASGMPVYAEIAGWAAVPVPLPEAVPAMLTAYGQARVDPAGIHLIEGHGAGTAAGDEAELTALARLRGGSPGMAALGAVSASIGYARAAAGVASLIKTVTAMVAGTIPPGTGCPRPHPLIESGAALLRLPAAPEPWPDGPRLAAVNSLGVADPATGGVHLVLRREADKPSGRGRRRRGAEPAEPLATVTAGRHTAPASASPAPAVGPPPTSTPTPAPAVGPPPTSTPTPAPAVAVPRPATSPDEPARGTPPGRLRVRDRGGRPVVFALSGAEQTAVAATLDVIAGSATELAEAELRDLARQLAATAQRTTGRDTPLRVAVTAGTPRRLAAQAQRAAQLLRNEQAVAMTIEPGIYISAGAGGTVVLALPGLPALADSPVAHAALLAGSLDGIRALDRLGVRPAAAVGYGFGELAGLVWAGYLPAAEAARLAALRGQVLRGCVTGRTAMARVHAGIELVRRLAVLDGLHFAAYETPTSHLLAGPATGIRDFARRTAETGATVEVIPGAAALHSPTLAGCAAPWRSVLAATQFAAPRRRLISTVTGQQITAAEDIAGLLTSQLTQPVLFEPAMALAAAGADLLVIAGPDPDLSLTAIAAAAAEVPAIGMPAATGTAAAAETVAALFVAGAVKDLMPFLAAPPLSENSVPATWAVPPARDGEPADRQAADGQNGTGRDTAVRSGKMVLMG